MAAVHQTVALRPSWLAQRKVMEQYDEAKRQFNTLRMMIYGAW
jgi:hypothetical protein